MQINQWSAFASAGALANIPIIARNDSCSQLQRPVNKATTLNHLSSVTVIIRTAYMPNCVAKTTPWLSSFALLGILVSTPL